MIISIIGKLIRFTLTIMAASSSMRSNARLQKQASLGESSEMARLSRLHWWTVEYGLIGNLQNPKIYGAGRAGPRN